MDRRYTRPPQLSPVLNPSCRSNLLLTPLDSVLYSRSLKLFAVPCFLPNCKFPQFSSLITLPFCPLPLITFPIYRHPLIPLGLGFGCPLFTFHGFPEAFSLDSPTLPFAFLHRNLVPFGLWSGICFLLPVHLLSPLSFFRQSF